jgi:hypothetical protein
MAAQERNAEFCQEPSEPTYPIVSMRRLEKPAEPVDNDLRALIYNEPSADDIALMGLFLLSVIPQCGGLLEIASMCAIRPQSGCVGSESRPYRQGKILFMQGVEPA